MYCRETHKAAKKMAHSIRLSSEEIELLEDELTVPELKGACLQIFSLSLEESIDGIIECADYDDETFCKVLDIQESTLQKWREEGMSEFEYDALVYMIVQAEIASDRAIEKMNFEFHRLSELID